MLTCFVAEAGKSCPVITVVDIAQFPEWKAAQPIAIQRWLDATQFLPEPNAVRVIPDAEGRIQSVVCCTIDRKSLWSVGHLSLSLPEGMYQFDANEPNYAMYAAAWGLGAYQFTRYKKATRAPAQLYLPKALAAQVHNTVESIYYVRDLINTPTDDMGPTQLAESVEQMAKAYGATFKQIVGEALLKENFPCIYTVGRASDDAPRLLDLRWGNPKHPKVTLVGKGVCFDTGGLDIKGSAHMLLMKKDMGGAAHVLGLARMIMEAKLPICLRVLIPAVENAVSGNAYRPGDIIKSRKGLTIEIGNTDAEGRVVLSDALTEAVSEKPEVLIDISTLTGAARIALGTELPAVFANNDALVNEVMAEGTACTDPMWRLPLFSQYREYLNSPIADINNNSAVGYGGAITAALFLKEFVPDDVPWLHFDIMAWNIGARPGRPLGGEAMTLRALFAYLQNRFGK